MSVVIVALAACGTPTSGATATAGSTTATTTDTATSPASGEASTTPTTTATTGESTSAGSTTFGDLEPMECPEDEVFVCRIDTSGECGALSSCTRLYKYCELGLCSELCESDCGPGWDCVDAGTPEMLVCVRDYSEHCDPWEPDCPEGTKCTTLWDDNPHRGCAPVHPAPVGPGEPCTVEDWTAGLDDCDATSMCWEVNPETQTGVCIPFCGGPPEMYSCPPGSSCAVTAEAILTLCLPDCDPVLQNCSGGDLCLPLGEGFGCVLDASGDQGIYADPCEYANACDAGLLCLQAADVPKCEAEKCCSPFCDLGEPNTCPGSGQSCVPFFDPDQAPDVYKHIGYCGIAR